MSPRSNSHLRLVGIAGAAALTIGAVAAPAIAASQDINYNCGTILGPTSVSLDPGTLPAKMVAGQTSKRTMSIVVHLTSAQADLARGQHITGTIVAKGASKSFPFTMTIPDQTVPATGAVDINASGPGKIRPLAAGTWLVKAGNMTANLSLNGGTPIPFACTAPTDATTHYGTIAVSKDTTKTTDSAAYSKTKKTATGTAKVKSHFGLVPTGKVAFTLKKGTHVIKTIKSSLSKKGVAKATFKNVTKKGKYTISTKYAGDKNVKGSTGKVSFTV